MSMTMKTAAAARPIPAAPAIPSIVRALVQIPGNPAETASPIRSRIARPAVSAGPSRDRETIAIRTMIVVWMRPSLIEARTMFGISVWSAAVAWLGAVMGCKVLGWLNIRRGLGTGYWGLGTGDWGLGTGDCGLGTGDWGLGTGCWRLGAAGRGLVRRACAPVS